MPRPSDPQARVRLLAAARKTFVEKGLDRAKVEDITQAAGMSKGAFYLHFQSKEQAFTEILSEALSEVGAIVAQGHANVATLYEQGLDHLVSHWLEQDIKVFDVVWKHRAIMALVLLEGGGSADYQHLKEMFVQRVEKQVETLIVFGMERGYYRPDLEPAQAANFISGGFDRLACQMLREKKKPDVRALMLQAHLFVIHALGTPELIALAARIHGSELPAASGVPPAPRLQKAHRSA
jgi:AcrR family transcriptional regulator